jgi:hypothetical protein
MRSMERPEPMRYILAAAILIGALTTGTNAQGNRCSTETLAVRRVPVTIALCVTGTVVSAPGGEVLVPLQAQYSSPSGSYAETETLRFIGGERTSRVIRSLDLSRVGSSGTLHLTLAYNGANVRVESALLSPGAVTIK